MARSSACLPRPLFGSKTLFQNLRPSDSLLECQLIASELDSYEPRLKVPESLNIACNHLQKISLECPSRLAVYKLKVEQFLLWSIHICRKPLVDIDDHDIADFQKFYSSPPTSWVATKPLPRFLVTSGFVSFNEDWRPFGKATDIVGRSLNVWDGLKTFIMKELPQVQSRLRVARPNRLNELSSKISDDQLSELVNSYLEYLFTIRSAKGAHESILFAFACASFMQLNTRAFIALTPHLYINKISRQPAGDFVWVVDAPSGPRTYQLPRTFEKYYQRYCDVIGFSEESSITRDQLAFGYTLRGDKVSRVTFNSWFHRAPRHPQICFKAYELLSLLASRSPAARDRAIQYAIERVEHSKRASKKSITRRKVGLSNLMSAMPSNKVIPQVSNEEPTPFPVFRRDQSSQGRILTLNFYALRKIFYDMEPAQVSGHADSIRILLLFIHNHPTRSSTDTDSNSYEKFVLWSMLYRNAGSAARGEQDAYRFFEFCCAPPPSWVSTHSHLRRFYFDCNAADTGWRPFVYTANSNLHAANTIVCCHRVQQWAVNKGIIDVNIFQKMVNLLNVSAT